ncbi:hypothetical protein GCK72_015267 [Caenorhabditis remanei]|uniref:Uncharacterized protein n=1 Tax=Caenorhabditis remanei TaxID=31234 RepID=A0A6A5GUE0_CAERE|nr:hypothetical protein GCK72_015267 [Caenorhabditis remanei]KAF1758807.1 hypothetical protein GCK72_015267 [Caenorhabditis remanei]
MSNNRNESDANCKKNRVGFPFNNLRLQEWTNHRSQIVPNRGKTPRSSRLTAPRARDPRHVQFRSVQLFTAPQPADVATRCYTIPYRIVRSRGSKFTRFRLHNRYRWIHQCEPRKPHYLKDFEGRSSSGQRAQKALLLKQKTPDGIRSIRKALMPQNEPKLYEQSTTGHRELMDKLKAPNTKISLVPTPVTHDPRLHCSFQSNDSSRIQHPVQLRHYAEHTSHEVTPNPRWNRCPLSTNG